MTRTPLQFRAGQRFSFPKTALEDLSKLCGAEAGGNIAAWMEDRHNNADHILCVISKVYLTKPFSFIVLIARLRALVRRGAPQRPVVLTAGSLSLDPVRRAVHRTSTPISLTPREYALLEYLMRNKDAVVTKTDILYNVWDHHYRGAYNVVEVYIGYLRRKIDAPFGTNTIETIRGVGYRLESGDFPTGN